DVDGVALRGEHHDRDSRLGANRAAHVDPAHPRQHEIEQHDIGAVLSKRRQSAFPIRDKGRQEPLTPQHDAEHLRQRGIIVDDQYSGSHANQYSISYGVRRIAITLTRRTSLWMTTT